MPVVHVLYIRIQLQEPVLTIPCTVHGTCVRSYVHAFFCPPVTEKLAVWCWWVIYPSAVCTRWRNSVLRSTHLDNVEQWKRYRIVTHFCRSVPNIGLTMTIPICSRPSLSLFKIVQELHIYLHRSAFLVSKRAGRAAGVLQDFLDGGGGRRLSMGGWGGPKDGKRKNTSAHQVHACIRGGRFCMLKTVTKLGWNF